jgi:hypothetical protein
MLSITNIPTHLWSVEVVGSSCHVFEPEPHSVDGSNLSSFLVAVLVRHPKLIPTEVGCSILEPAEPFVEAVPPLFLRSSEIINSKCDLLHFRAFIRVAEVHDFNPPSDLDVDGLADGDDDSGEEDYPGCMSDPRILHHWPS